MGWLNIVFTPFVAIEPQEGVGGATPMPMKDKNASVKIAAGIAKVSVTRMTPIVLGRMCLRLYSCLLHLRDVPLRYSLVHESEGPAHGLI